MDRSASIVVLGVVLGLGRSTAVEAAAPGKGGAAPAKGAAASEPDVEALPPQVPNLAVWVEPGVPDGDRVAGWVAERGAVILRDQQPALEPEDLIRVAVRGGPYDYQIHLALLRRRHLLEEQLEVIFCECGSDEMLDRVGKAIEEGARRLADAAARERAAAKEPPPPPEPVTEPIEDRKARKLGAMGYAGIGVGVLGVGVLAAGIPLSVRPDVIRGGPGSVSVYSTHRPGIGLAVGGGAALATGVALIVADVVRWRKKPQMVVVPTVGRELAGVWVVRRF